MQSNLCQFIIFFAIGAFISGCQTSTAKNSQGADSSKTDSPATTAHLTKEHSTTDWIVLFDGKSTDSWTNVDGGKIGSQWQIIDNQLVLTEQGGGDILTKENYENFELVLEWKISKQGNSGIFYRVAPGSDVVWYSGLEYQILDDEDYPGLSKKTHTSGSLFDIYAPSKKAVNPAGAYNQTKIVVKDNQVEHWLNNVKIVSFTIDSQKWQMDVANSKFSKAQRFGKTSNGRIGLQDHGNKVWFKNIKIRRL